MLALFSNHDDLFLLQENGALFEGSVELVKWENVFSNARPRKGNEVKVVLFSDLTKLDDGDGKKTGKASMSSILINESVLFDFCNKSSAR